MSRRFPANPDPRHQLAPFLADVLAGFVGRSQAVAMQGEFRLFCLVTGNLQRTRSIFRPFACSCRGRGAGMVAISMGWTNNSLLPCFWPEQAFNRAYQGIFRGPSGILAGEQAGSECRLRRALSSHTGRAELVGPQNRHRSLSEAGQRHGPGLGAGEDGRLDLRREEGEADDPMAMRCLRRLFQDRQAEGIAANGGMGCAQRADQRAVGAGAAAIALDDLGPATTG
jgi:hypothetical protein